MQIRKRLLALLAAMILLVSLLPLNAAASDNFPEVLARTKQGVVQIYGLGNTSCWTGTGFAIGQAGEDSNIFLTNQHVVSDEDTKQSDIKLWILLEGCQIQSNYEPDPAKSIPCKLLKTTGGYPDYAIIQATSETTGFHALPLMSSESVADGTKVYALGFPGEVGSMSTTNSGIDDITSTDGIVSQHLQMAGAGNTWTLMHTALISKGNSGGPLITAEGAVVGLNTYSFGESGGRYCAVYIDYAMEGLDELDIAYDLYEEDTQDSTEPAEEGKSWFDRILGIFLDDKEDEEALTATEDDEETWYDRILELMDGEKEKEERKLKILLTIAIVVAFGLAAGAVILYLRSQERARQAAEQTRRQEDRRRREEERRRDEESQKKLVQTIRICSASGRVYPVDNVTTIGRDPNCTIVLPADAHGVSRNHCRLENRNGQLILTDLNSTYGTIIHGQRLPAGQPVALKPGSHFSLGSDTYTFTVC